MRSCGRAACPLLAIEDDNFERQIVAFRRRLAILAAAGEAGRLAAIRAKIQRERPPDQTASSRALRKSRRSA